MCRQCAFGAAWGHDSRNEESDFGSRCVADRSGVVAAVGSVKGIHSGETWRSFLFPPFPQAPRVRWSLHSRDRTEMWKGSLDAPNIWMYYDIFWTILYIIILYHDVFAFSTVCTYFPIYPIGWTYWSLGALQTLQWRSMYFALEGARLLSSFERNRSTHAARDTERCQIMCSICSFHFGDEIWCRIES